MDEPYFSIIIPARDEEAYLPACLEAVHKSTADANADFEIIVVINRCEDRTEEIAKEAGCRIVKSQAKNLAKIRNEGVKAAKGEVVVTIDADSRINKGMLAHIKKTIESGRYVGGGVFMLMDRLSLGIFLTFLLLLPIVLIDPIFGGVFFLRKTDFDEIGGFNEEFISAEDIDFAKRLKAHGKTKGQKFALLFRSYIVTSSRKFDALGDWYFLKNPKLFMTLLKGRSQKAANFFWYDFKR